MDPTEVVTKRSNPSKFKAGNICSRITYLKIDKVNSYGNITVSTPGGTSWNIKGAPIIEEQIDSPDQYTEIESLSMTQLADAFVHIPGDSVFTVCFLKKDGSQRILIGNRISQGPNNLGRSAVRDLEKTFTGEHDYREVDHRTILWFICKNKKYQLK